MPFFLKTPKGWGKAAGVCFDAASTGLIGTLGQILLKRAQSLLVLAPGSFQTSPTYEGPSEFGRPGAVARFAAFRMAVMVSWIRNKRGLTSRRKGQTLSKP